MMQYESDIFKKIPQSSTGKTEQITELTFTIFPQLLDVTEVSLKLLTSYLLELN